MSIYFHSCYSKSLLLFQHTIFAFVRGKQKDTLLSLKNFKFEKKTLDRRDLNLKHSACSICAQLPSHIECTLKYNLKFFLGLETSRQQNLTISI